MLAIPWINRMEKQTGEDLSYARDIAQASPRGFWKLALMKPVVSHQGTAPPTLHHLARLGSLMAEDCGGCLQTQVNEARAAGLSRDLLHRVVGDGGDSLAAVESAAYQFGRGVALNTGVPQSVRQSILEECGPQGLVDLTIAAASVRIFPALKRGLGYAESCTVVQIEL